MTCPEAKFADRLVPYDTLVEDLARQNHRVALLERALATMTAEYHRWHDAYMELKYPKEQP